MSADLSFAQGDTRFPLFEQTLGDFFVAMVARLPDAVQIGNVWTPTALRGRGYARAVVAGALRCARDEGATEAVLFTATDNNAARKAYLATGFTRIGDYAIVLLKT